MSKTMKPKPNKTPVTMCQCQACRHERVINFMASIDMLKAIESDIAYEFTRRKDISATQGLLRNSNVPHVWHAVKGGTMFICPRDIVVGEGVRYLPTKRDEVMILVDKWQRQSPLWGNSAGLFYQFVDKVAGNRGE